MATAMMRAWQGRRGPQLALTATASWLARRGRQLVQLVVRTRTWWGHHGHQVRDGRATLQAAAAAAAAASRFARQPQCTCTSLPHAFCTRALTRVPTPAILPSCLPAAATPVRPAGSDDDSSDDGSDGGEADDPSSDPYQLPISHEVSLQGFGRGVTCLDVEHSGNRLVVGSMDNSLRLFDFNGMKADLRSFRCGVCMLRGMRDSSCMLCARREGDTDRERDKETASKAPRRAACSLSCRPPHGRLCNAPQGADAVGRPPRARRELEPQRRRIPVCDGLGAATRVRPRRQAARRVRARRHVHPRHEEHQGTHNGLHGRRVAPDRPLHRGDVLRGRHRQV